MITQADLHEWLNYNPETGVFTWNKKPNRRIKAGSAASNPRRDGYERIGLMGRRYLTHRLAWLHVFGELPDCDIDHINGDPSDNRICNLRKASRSENLFNRGPGKNNKSGHKGVFWNSKSQRWQAVAQVRGVSHCLGFYREKSAAVQAYREFAKCVHGEFYRNPSRQDKAA